MVNDNNPKCLWKIWFDQSYVVSVFIGTKLCVLIKFLNDTYIQPNFKTANEISYGKNEDVLS